MVITYTTHETGLKNGTGIKLIKYSDAEDYQLGLFWANGEANGEEVELTATDARNLIELLKVVSA